MFENLKEKGWEIAFINNANAILPLNFNQTLVKLEKILAETSVDVEKHIIKGGGGESDFTINLRKRFNDLGWKKNNIQINNTITFEGNLPEIELSSTTHEIDHLIEDNNRLIALEIEWNNKDEFFDRDFQAITRLYEASAVEAGIIITRGPNLEKQLGTLIENYFIQNKITDHNGHEMLSKRIRDDKGSRYTFPTDKQKINIEKKYKSGKSYAESSMKVFKESKFGSSTTTWKQLNNRIDRKLGSRTPMLFLGIPEVK